MNPRVVAQAASAIRALNARKRPTSIDLGLGEPTLAPRVAHFERATAWIAEHGCRYAATAGDADLRAAIARHYGYPSFDAAENVCVTTGSQEAVYAALKTVLDPACDELLIVEPAFPVYAKIAVVEGIAVRRVAMRVEDDFALDPRRIVEAIGPATRMIVICSPCNPTGRALTTAAARFLADALAARPGPPITVLHDEIYRELRYVDEIGDIAAWYPWTIAINSLSKSNALTGLRIGWSIAPVEMTRELVKTHAWLTSCASTVAQRVALAVLGERRARGTARPWYAERNVTSRSRAARDWVARGRAGGDVLSVDRDRRARRARVRRRADRARGRRHDPGLHLRRRPRA